MTERICPRFAKIDPWGETIGFCHRWFSLWSENCGRDDMIGGQNAMRFVQSGLEQWAVVGGQGAVVGDGEWGMSG